MPVPTNIKHDSCRCGGQMEAFAFNINDDRRASVTTATAVVRIKSIAANDGAPRGITTAATSRGCGDGGLSGFRQNRAIAKRNRYNRGRASVGGRDGCVSAG